jgi:N-acetylmuramoyl-L-alanine amidase
MKFCRYLIFTVVIFMLVGCSSTNNSKDYANNTVTGAQISEGKKVEDTSEKIGNVSTEVNNALQENNKEVSTNLPEIKKTDAEPKKKVIVIDPGHANRSNLEKEPNAPGSNLMKIKDGGGATGITTKTPEHVINMEVALRLKSLLEQRDYKVIMTKTDHSQSLGNVERAKIGNDAKADLVIRIHCDANDNSAAIGASMLIPQSTNGATKKIYEESKRCGEIVLNTLTKQVGIKNRGLIYSQDMTGFNWSEVPVILVEMGFLSNPQEDKLLSDSSYQDKLAKALAEGISEAIK